MHTANSCFDLFQLTPELVERVSALGFTQPTQVQEETIPLILEGHDVVALAKTGSGKTAAFALPMLHKLIENRDKSALILTPTRELATQVATEIERLHRGIPIAIIVGGTPISTQIRQIEQGARIIVATPGRLLDLIQSHHLSRFSPSIVVLDEADEMLAMGFIDDVESILSHMGTKRQTLLFSATMAKPIEVLIRKMLSHPKYCGKEQDCSSKHIDQLFYLTPHKARTATLSQLLLYHKPKKSIVFCKMKNQVDELAATLATLGIRTFRLHGDMIQKERQLAIEQFRKAEEGALIATDIAGRGINILDVTHVFNCELPHSVDSYTHRIGRTGRAGNSGTAITLLSNQEFQWAKRNLKKGETVELSLLPSIDEFQQKQKEHLLNSVKEGQIDAAAQELLQDLTKEFSLEEIALHFLSKVTRPMADILTFSIPSEPPRRERERDRDRDRSRGRDRDRDDRPRQEFSRKNNGNNQYREKPKSSSFRQEHSSSFRPDHYRGPKKRKIFS